MDELDGCFNEDADKLERVNETWSDTNFDDKFDKNEKLIRLECRNCGGLSFEIIHRDDEHYDYTTMSKCEKCGMYYIVHAG